MRGLTPLTVALTFLISANITGMPRSASAADDAQAPSPHWPDTIATGEATIMVYTPQAIAWREYHSLEA